MTAPSDVASPLDVDALVGAVRDGVASIALPPPTKARAVDEVRRWLSDERFAAYRPQIVRLVETKQWASILDRFYRVLPFGTGGRRGPVGIGPNRFNPWTLACSVQGNADYLRARHPGETLTVVVAYDVRVFNDLRGRYDAGLPSPLRGIRSRDFAALAAEVFAANGIRVFLSPEGSTRYVSTPELSFSIRRLRATGGLNVSASHNHPDDNGGKFYNAEGAQSVPPDDEEMAAYADRVERVKSIPLARALAEGLVVPIPSEVHDEYVALNVRQSIRPDAREARVVFTPLHGTGLSTVGEVLTAAGFRVDVVPEQSTPDGTFPAVPYRAPNPEVPESMDLGVALAKRVGADLVLACDPDADRIGVCSRTRGGAFRFLTGNEIAALVAHGKLSALEEAGRLPASPLLIKTEVTTEMLAPIARRFHGSLVGDLLVGFKYHARVLLELERRGAWGSIRATLADFVAAVEESHGVLVTPEIRDKDAAGAALLLAEAASVEKRRGRTLADALDDLHREFGCHANLVTSMVMSGAEGLADMARIQDALRRSPPASIGGLAVTRAVDHWDERGIHGPIVSETDRASRNVLVYRLENGARVSVRPSGTEPKSKTYVEVPAPPLGKAAGDDALARQRAETDGVARRIADDLTRQMLARIGISLPDYALRISGLVALDRRLDFVRTFVPELLRRAGAVRRGEEPAAAASAWIDRHLASYGADGRRLVGDAMVAFLAEARAPGAAHASAADLATAESLFSSPAGRA
jgi:phosphoglucomutase/phosphomannomutase